MVYYLIMESLLSLSLTFKTTVQDTLPFSLFDIQNYCASYIATADSVEAYLIGSQRKKALVIGITILRHTLLLHISHIHKVLRQCCRHLSVSTINRFEESVTYDAIMFERMMESCKWSECETTHFAISHSERNWKNSGQKLVSSPNESSCIGDKQNGSNEVGLARTGENIHPTKHLLFWSVKRLYQLCLEALLALLFYFKLRWRRNMLFLIWNSIGP